MNIPLNILFITQDLSQSCGVTTHLYHLLKELKKEQSINKIILICSGGEIIDRFNSLGIEIIIDRNFLHKERSILKYLISVVKLFLIVKRNKINIIHSHNHYASSIAAKVKIINRKIKTVQTIHGLFPDIGRLNLFTGEYLIAVNDHIYNFIIQNKIKIKNKLLIIRSGIPIKQVSKVFSKNKLKVLCASRLIPEKGIETFIRAVSLLPDNIKKLCDFYIAGIGDYEEELKKLDFDLKTGIEFPGEIFNIMEFMETTDIFVIASRSEGFPMTIIESGINKNLIIASKCDGYDIFLKDNFDCLLFPVDNTEILSEKIVYAIKNPDQTSFLVENMYKKITTYFDIEKNIKELICLYKT